MKEKNVEATGDQIQCMVCDKEFVWKYNFRKNEPVTKEYVKARLVVKNQYIEPKRNNATVLEMIASIDCPNCGVTNERYHTIDKESLLID